MSNVTLLLHLSEPVLGTGVGGVLLPDDFTIVFDPTDVKMLFAERRPSGLTGLNEDRRALQAGASVVAFSLRLATLSADTVIGVNSAEVAPVDGHVVNLQGGYSLLDPVVATGWPVDFEAAVVGGSGLFAGDLGGVGGEGGLGGVWGG